MDFEIVLLRFIVNIIPVVSAVYVIAGIRLFSQKGADQANYFALLMFSAAIYSFGYYLELISESLHTMLVFRDFEYFGVSFIPAFGLLFVAQFTGTRTMKITRALLFAFSAVLWIAFITNPLHGLFYSGIGFYRGEYSIPLTVKGPVYYVLLAYFGVFLAYSNILMVKALRTAATRSRRKSVRFVMLAMLIPWIAVGYILAGLDTYFDIVPAAIFVVCILFMINEVKNDMFMLRIVQWKNNYACVESPVILTDAENKVVAGNLHANILMKWNNLDVGDIQRCAADNTLLRIVVNDENRWFEVRRTEFDICRNLTSFILGDVTESNKKDRLLHVVTAVTQEFLETHDFMEVIPDAFQQLGETLDVSRVYLFRNRLDASGEVGSSSQIAEWCAQDVSVQAGNPDLQDIPAADLEIALSLMKAGEPFSADIKDLDNAAIKALMESQDIRSLLVLPILANGVFWGFIGFDECRHEWNWTDMEKGVLKLFTSSVTKAIERQHTENLLMKSEQKNRAILSAIPDMFFILSADGVIIDYYTSQENELFTSPENFINKHIHDIIPASVAVPALAMIRTALESGHVQQFEYSLGEETVKFYEARIVPNNTDSALLIVRSISERKKLEMALAQEKNLLETTLVSVGDGVISTDRNGNVIFMNRIAESLTGWSAEEANARPISEVFSIVNEFTREKSGNSVEQVISRREILKLDYHTELIARDGYGRPVEGSAAPIIQENGELVGAVLVFRDFSEKKRGQEEIEFLSFHDQLTGLYNRRYYDKAIDMVDQAEYLPLALVMIDVNGVKITNDAFGHKAGDQLLKKVADILKRECRTGDIIARIGGDEFVLLMPQTDAVDAEKIIDRINAALAVEKSEKIVLSISTGFTVRYGLSEDIETAFKKAEDLMYKNKLTESPDMKTRTVDLIMHALYEIPSERNHSRRVSEVCAAIASRMDFSVDEVAEVSLAGLMHDIGKVGIDERILSRPKTVINDEWSGIERHPEIGYRILNSIAEYTDTARMVLQHHERWDGSGYPMGLREDGIMQQARIIAVADYYDVLTSERSLCETDAIAEIGKRSGTQFDPAVVAVLKDLTGQLWGASVNGGQAEGSAASL
ncbi:MAG: histidine kinase N-terminal 7TM domain-containing protein [Saccharofermentanales bacterium]